MKLFSRNIKMPEQEIALKGSGANVKALWPGESYPSFKICLLLVLNINAPKGFFYSAILLMINHQQIVNFTGLGFEKSNPHFYENIYFNFLLKMGEGDSLARLQAS